MRLGVQLTLPRDSRYVPIMRHVAFCLLEDVSAPREAIADIQVALSEACANVVRHADGCEDYCVSLSVDHGGCQIDVVDLGPGFDPPDFEANTSPAVEGVEVDLESGRGLLLIDALVDDLQFLNDEDETCVRLVKRWPTVNLDTVAVPSRS